MSPDNLKFGLNVYNHPPEELMTYAVQNDLQHLEINMGSEYTRLSAFNNERIRKIKNLAEDHAIALSLHLPYEINIAEIIPPIRKKSMDSLKRSIKLAGKLGAKFITAHMGTFYWFPHRNWTRRRALDRFIRGIRQVLPLCESERVTIALENSVRIPDGSEYYFLGDNPSDFEYIFAEIPSPFLKFCLDTGHANMGAGVSAFLEKLQKKMVSIHYHDNHGDNDAHFPVGEGTVNWQAFAKAFSGNHFSGPFISECRNIKPHEAAALLQKYF